MAYAAAGDNGDYRPLSRREAPPGRDLKSSRRTKQGSPKRGRRFLDKNSAKTKDTKQAFAGRPTSVWLRVAAQWPLI